MKILKMLAAYTAFLSLALLANAGQIADATKGNLVRLSGDKLAAVTDDPLAGKEIIAIYYSAHWCPPCRKFTPELVKFYNENRAKYPKFELIFASSDKSADAMWEYMNSTQMPWLALKYSKRNIETLGKHSARGIPYLVVLDADGNELIAKAKDQDWRSPSTVLPELKKLLEQKK